MTTLCHHLTKASSKRRDKLRRVRLASILRSAIRSTTIFTLTEMLLSCILISFALATNLSSFVPLAGATSGDGCHYGNFPDNELPLPRMH